MEEFLTKLAEALEMDKVDADAVLTDLPEWDSLSVLSVIAMIDSQHRVNVLATELKDVGTAAGLYALVQQKKAAK